MPLFDGGTYPASAVTLEPSRLVFLPRADFEQLYRAGETTALVQQSADKVKRALAS